MYPCASGRAYVYAGISAIEQGILYEPGPGTPSSFRPSRLLVPILKVSFRRLSGLPCIGAVVYVPGPGTAMDFRSACLPLIENAASLFLIFVKSPE